MATCATPNAMQAILVLVQYAMNSVRLGLRMMAHSVGVPGTVRLIRIGMVLCAILNAELAIMVLGLFVGSRAPMDTKMMVSSAEGMLTSMARDAARPYSAVVELS